MNRKLILTSLMLSVMGFSSLFAQEEEESNVKSAQHLSCDCDHAEEEVKVSLIEEEEAAIKAQQSISCDKCKGKSIEDEIKEIAIS